MRLRLEACGLMSCLMSCVCHRVTLCLDDEGDGVEPDMSTYDGHKCFWKKVYYSSEAEGTGSLSLSIDLISSQ
jgi:hypothetical protein